jgi:hypothetical protein
MMKLRVHQWGELIGILFLLASTATQIFYVDPLKREIEWRLAAFNMQQNGQVQVRAIYGNRIATLRALKAPEAEVKAAESERDKVIERYKAADANVSDYLVEKEWVEDTLQIVVVVLFAIGSLLAGFGRAMEMIASRKVV